MIARRIYRLLLVCYPAEFRREHGSEMLEQFSEEWTAASQSGLAARSIFWLYVLSDWLLSAVRAQGETAVQDLRSAAGSLRRRSFSSITLILLFSVVISANTCVLTIANAMLFHPLPYESQGRMVYIAQLRAAGSVDWQPIPIELARAWRDQSRTLTELAFFSDFTTQLGGAPVHVFLVTPQVLKNLEITADYGRLPQMGDAESNEAAATLGPRLWQRLYGRSRSAVGKTIRFLGREYRVAGAVKQQPDFPFDADVWLPLPSNVTYVSVFGRLNPGASLRDAQAEGKEIQRRATNDFPIQLDWLRNSNLDARYRFILWLLQAAFLAALLVTCADLGTFQFVQVERRRRDLAIRMALGASRSRLLRFLLTETLLMAAAAAVLSLPLTMGAISLWREKLDFWGLHRIAGWSSIRFDRTTVAVALGLSLFSGILGAIVPSWRMASQDAWGMLYPRSQARNFAGRIRLALLGAQFGMSALATFLALTFYTEGRERLASPAVRFFEGTWQAMLPAGAPAQSPVILKQLTHRLESRGYAPLVVWPPPFSIEPEPFQYESGGRRLLAEWMSVNGRFLAVPGFHWRSGHVWIEGDAESCDRLRIVVNDALARSAGNLSGSIVLVNANGHRVKAEITGVVEQPSLDLYQTRAGPMIFIPYQCATIPQRNLIVPLRPGVPEAIRQAVREIDPSLQPTLRDFGLRIRDNGVAWRFVTAALWCAALLAFGLALTGIAVHLTQTCAERSYEMAMRCALGAIASDIRGLLTREASPALAVGTAGAAASGIGVLWLPTGLTPASVGAVVTASTAAILLLASVWALASYFVSGKATVRLPDRLRTLD